jgi:mRNA-degrading endonuclease YafQ of YafQ-DinJ toxin-antitoxin module
VFRINPSDKFKRSYKELLKRHYKGEKAQKLFQDFIAQILRNLSSNPFLPDSFAEKLPGSLSKPEKWEFRKYYFDMPNLRGAARQGRLMYLVDRTQSVIELAWIYTHSEFPKRPPDKNLKQLLAELMESQQEEENLSESNDDQGESTTSNDR